jgi:hypothetical protein
MPGDGPPDQTLAGEPVPQVAPLQMPAPPQMPVGDTPPSAWGSQVPPPAPQPSVAPASGPEAQPSPLPPSPASPVPRSSVTPEPSRGADDAREPEPSSAAADEAHALGEPSSDDAPPSADAPAPRPKAGVAPVVQGDWLASVCPYLASEDGTYRSAAPVEGHRCTAQDPPATLPLAFQERYCLTDRHPRCEMYKFAQETDASGAIPAAQVPPTVPPTPRVRRSSGGRPRGPLVVAAAGIGIVMLVVLLVLAMSSCSGDGGPTGAPEATSDLQGTEAPAATPAPTPAPTPTPQPEPTPEPDPDATPGVTEEATVAEIRILYEIQPDEALRRISETFGISRNRIRRENPGLDDIAPADMAGTVIELPIAGEMTLEQAELLPGYQGIAP